MKLFTGWMLSAGLILTAATANAQMLERYGIERAPYAVASDIAGPPMAAAPSEELRYGQYVLAPPEVDGILRENGFSPLGVPHLRGIVYTVSVLDRAGDDGRLVIDARTGRIISFMPANQLGEDLNGDLTQTYGPRPSGPPLRPSVGVLRPPASVPHVVASRTTPVPQAKVSPRSGEASPLAARPAPVTRAQEASVARSKPADAQAAMPAPVEVKPAVEAKPAVAKPGEPLIRPTQPLPEVQGLD
jgi:hypothetical protein